MGFLFPSSPPPPPKPDDKEVQAERLRQQRLAIALKGREDTILTGGAGVLGDAPVVKKKLLGE